MTFALVELSSEDPTASQVLIVQNGGTTAVDLRCWQVRSARRGSAVHLISGRAAPGGHVQFLAPYAAFASDDRLTLLRPDGTAADVTPELKDDAGDSRVWFDQDGQWVFGRPTTKLAASDGRAAATASC